MRTYRDKEHNLLMDIRNGKFQNNDHTFKQEFFELVDDLEKKFLYASENTVLPDMSAVTWFRIPARFSEKTKMVYKDSPPALPIREGVECI